MSGLPAAAAHSADFSKILFALLHAKDSTVASIEEAFLPYRRAPTSEWVHTLDASGLTPLCVAARRGDVEIVRWLFRHGAKAPDATAPEDRDTAGSERRHARRATTHASASMPAPGGRRAAGAGASQAPSPLFLAVEHGHFAVAEVLLSAGWSANATYEGRACLQIAAARGDAPMCELLMSHGAVRDAQMRSGAVALHLAASAGHLDVCRLLKSSARIAMQDRTLPLHLAARAGHADVCKLLVNAGTSVEAMDQSRRPLHHAAANGCTAACDMLIRCKADVNSLTSHGLTALHLAAQQGYDETCTLLLARGAQVNYAGKSGQAPLAVAASTGQVSTILLLVRHGADTGAMGDGALAPIHLAAWRDHALACRALVQAGADVMQRCPPNDTTALHIAARFAHEATCTALVTHGAQLDALSAGRTPFEVAPAAKRRTVMFAIIRGLKERAWIRRVPVTLARKKSRA